MRRRRQKTKQQTKWVTSPAGYGTELALANNTVTGAILVGSTGAAAQFDPPVIGRWTVNRVIGEILFRTDGGTAGVDDYYIVHAGICIRRISVGTATTATPDPGAQVDGAQPWMWLRHYVFNSPVNAVHGPWVVPILMDMHVDTKVKRVMHPDDQLAVIFRMNVIIGAAPPTWTARPFLRTLISRVA